MHYFSCRVLFISLHDRANVVTVHSLIALFCLYIRIAVSAYRVFILSEVMRSCLVSVGADNFALKAHSSPGPTSEASDMLELEVTTGCGNRVFHD